VLLRHIDIDDFSLAVSQHIHHRSQAFEGTSRNNSSKGSWAWPSIILMMALVCSLRVHSLRDHIFDQDAEVEFAAAGDEESGRCLQSKTL
jgi:hypothetical protein